MGIALGFAKCPANVSTRKKLPSQRFRTRIILVVSILDGQQRDLPKILLSYFQIDMLMLNLHALGELSLK
jgi:hypothetical protein